MKTYASKLLLFGEYTIINGSRALAIPYDRYFGTWQFGSEPDRRLLDFVDYLQQKEGDDSFLDIATFQQEVKQGLIFQSNIPIGYGLGSSGALCAAVYDRYALAPISPKASAQFGLLRKQLAEMESHFHGSSSGTDPLICYLHYPVVIHPQEGIHRVGLPLANTMPYSVFLLDTQIPRSTGPLVERYLAKCQDLAYADRIAQELTPTVDQVIDDFLLADWLKVEQAFQKISQFQLAHFLEMIPPILQLHWERGLTSNDFALKLCGAGGGGFLLGITRNTEILEDLNKHFPCAKIW